MGLPLELSFELGFELPRVVKRLKNLSIWLSSWPDLHQQRNQTILSVDGRAVFTNPYRGCQPPVAARVPRLAGRPVQAPYKNVQVVVGILVDMNSENLALLAEAPEIVPYLCLGELLTLSATARDLLTYRDKIPQLELIQTRNPGILLAVLRRRESVTRSSTTPPLFLRHLKVSPPTKECVWVAPLLNLTPHLEHLDIQCLDYDICEVLGTVGRLTKLRTLKLGPSRQWAKHDAAIAQVLPTALAPLSSLMTLDLAISGRQSLKTVAAIVGTLPSLTNLKSALDVVSRLSPLYAVILQPLNPVQCAVSAVVSSGGRGTLWKALNVLSVYEFHF